MMMIHRGLFLLPLLAACSSSGSLGTPADGPRGNASNDASGDATTTYPAFHPALPQIVTLGGRVLPSPAIVPVTYDGDPLRDHIEAYTAGIGTSSYWNVVAQYGVGPAHSAPPIHIATPAPANIDDAQIQTWLAQMLDGTHPEWPMPDGNTIYTLFYPPGTTYDNLPPSACFYGNDTSMTLASGVDVPYIIIPRCPAFPGFTDIDSLDWTISHEYVEESTDPYETAYVTMDADHMAWSFEPNFVEIGDICNYPFNTTTPADFGYTVQRAWSNAAAASGGDPCVPAPADRVYFNAAPVLEDDVPIRGPRYQGTPGWQGTTMGVHIPVGETRTVEVDLFSAGPTSGPWQVEATDWGADPDVCGATCGAPHLQLALDHDSGSNGDKLQLSITTLRKGAGGGSRFLLKSTLEGYTTYWVGWVGDIAPSSTP
jgi:hypothetical protein